MSRRLTIVNGILVIITIHVTAYAASLIDNIGKIEKEPIIITSETLTADSKNNTATFEGSVMAKTSDIVMYSDRMTVFYDNSEQKVKKIHAIGNVKVHKQERALFSQQAIYLDDERKIIFTGNPKAVEGENVITGTQIIFYLKDDRAVVEGSRVFLQSTQGLK